MNNYQGQSRDQTIFPKRESPQDSLHLKQEDELTTLGGKTRLVSPKSAGPGSSRGSRSPPMQSPLAAFSSPPPQTPTSPSSAPQSQNAYYADPYAHRAYDNTEAYPSSPNYVFPGHDNNQIQGHGQIHSVPQLQQAHAQAQAYAHSQWQADPSLSMGYGAPMDTSGTMPQMAGSSSSIAQHHQQVGVAHGMEDILGTNGHGLSMQGQYGLNGGYYGAPDYRNTYGQQQNYLPSPQDIVSPQDVDLTGAWSNFMTSYGTT